ncbi:MAG: DUF4398 domain-containing protein [Usitatibacter sp.]
MMANSLRVPAILLTAAMAAGCSIHPSPDGRILAADDAIARAARTSTTIGEPVELARAREKIALARLMARTDDRKPASWLAEQAKVDAELAEAKMFTARARLAAATARREFASSLQPRVAVNSAAR